MKNMIKEKRQILLFLRPTHTHLMYAISLFDIIFSHFIACFYLFLSYCGIKIEKAEVILLVVRVWLKKKAGSLSPPENLI